jgi:hypothetical protein
MRHVAFVLALLSAALLYASVIIVEVPDDDATPVAIRNVIDGDTVELADGRRVRLVGYDAYELSEPLGQLAKRALSGLCSSKAYLDVDDLEPRDRYGRILGYLWCQRTDGNATWHINVQKHFMYIDRQYVKKLLHVPPDEHPPTLWTVRHVVKFDRVIEVYVYNDSRAPYRIHSDAVVLTSGIYEVYYFGRLIARLRLMSHNATVAHLGLSAADAAAETRPTPTAATTAVSEKPYIRVIYVLVATAAASAISALILARRRRA